MLCALLWRVIVNLLYQLSAHWYKWAVKPTLKGFWKNSACLAYEEGTYSVRVSLKVTLACNSALKLALFLPEHYAI
jgi:hypothetical protein